MLLKLLSKKARRKKFGSGLKAVLGDYEMPTFSGVIMRALEQVRDADAPLSSIADTLAADLGVTVRLLATTNSPVFAIRYKVSSIHHAASLLGRSQLESILISLAVRDTLPRGPVRGFEPVRFWRTSARRAITAAELAERIDPSTRSESFTASLLQDMAMPILAHQRPERYGEILEHWHNSDDDVAALEQSAFGWNHAQIGDWMGTEWKFPKLLTEAIGGHHQAEAPALPAVNLVAALREVNEQQGIERLIETTRARHGIREDETTRLLEASFEEAESIARLFT